MMYKAKGTLSSESHTKHKCNVISFFFLPPMRPHVLMNFRSLPPGCGDSLADFWGWDAHEARLRCPDGVWVVICRKMK